MKKEEPTKEVEAKEKKPSKFLYYLDESIVFVVVLIGILSAQAFKKALKGQTIGWQDFVLDWPNIIIAVLVAFVLYGLNYTKPYNERGKPPMRVRISTGLSYGFSWRLLLSGDSK